jgi:hypothetical protein
VEQFWKLARTDGYDWYTGKTINYRENIGKDVVCPRFNKDGQLCSSAFLHASRKINDCFVGAKIPCSVYRVSGAALREDAQKCGFASLRVLKEIAPEKAFGWNYAEAVNPFNPFRIAPPKITARHIALVKKWDSVWASVWAYIGHLFPLKRQEWKYTEQIKTKGYPFQPAVDLWIQGLVPSFDGNLWRLHGGLDAKVLWEGSFKK